MKKSVIAPILAIVLAAVVLLGLNVSLHKTAQANAQAEHLRIMQTLLPGSKTFQLEPYTGEDANIVSVHKAENGFVIETTTRGYADELTVLVGVSNEGTVTGLVVKDMHETWGLGAQVLTDWEFLAQFLKTSGGVSIGTAGEDAFSGATGSDSTEVDTYVDGITGATVTSKAIARCVNSAVAFVTGADTDSGATSWGG